MYEKTVKENLGEEITQPRDRNKQDKVTENSSAFIYLIENGTEKNFQDFLAISCTKELHFWNPSCVFFFICFPQKTDIILESLSKYLCDPSYTKWGYFAFEN